MKRDQAAGTAETGDNMLPLLTLEGDQIKTDGNANQDLGKSKRRHE